MDWVVFLLPPATIGLAIGHMGEGRLRRALVALLIAAPIVMLGAVLVIGLDVSSELLLATTMVAPVVAAWMMATGVFYFAAKRFAAWRPLSTHCGHSGA